MSSNFDIKKSTKKPSKKDPVKEEPTQAEETSPLGNNIIMLPGLGGENTSRSIGLIGDVNEERASEVVYALLSLWKSYTPPEDKPKERPDPIELYISTHGGSASDMFAIYDVMRMVKKDSDISTVGLGKVMSAGVLLLAAGTKGKRKIGKNCRVMVHQVSAGTSGPQHEMLNEIAEIQYTQEQYIRCLAAETKMSVSHIKKLFDQKVNIYMSAEEAVKNGLADIIV